MTMHFVALLCRIHDKSDCFKTFDTLESQFMLFGNILFLLNSVYLESFILQKGDCLKRGYLCSDCACARSRRPFEMK